MYLSNAGTDFLGGGGAHPPEKICTPPEAFGTAPKVFASPQIIYILIW
jgi:hypothetical protein